MSFHLQAGSGKWSDLFATQDASGCILLDINAAGQRCCVGTLDVEIENEAGVPVRFDGAILNDPVHSEFIDPFSRESSVQSMVFEVAGSHFSLRDFRKSGMILQDIDADVYWHVSGHGHSLGQSFHLLSGKLTQPQYDEKRDISRFSVEDARLQGERMFPPVIAKNGVLPFDSEMLGKPYPIVVGTVKKLPVLDIGMPALTQFLAMHDPLNEFSGAPATALYDGDDGVNPGIGAQSFGTDASGNRYLQIDTFGGAATTSKDVTVDLTGHTPDTLGETLRYLLTSFGNDADIFDKASLDRIDAVMSEVSINAAFNSRGNSGVLGLIRDRFLPVFPIMMVQQGGKYIFESLTWGRDVVKHLRTGHNILKKTASPTETRRADIYSNYVVRYGRSGLRGDYTGCVTADKDTHHECQISAARHGETVPMEVNAGDVSSANGANWLLNWLVETYSRMRVFTGYRCDLDVVGVHLWDTVSVVDEYELWENALFKVIKIRRGTGPWVDLGLVSIDDYTNVYGVNK